MTGFSRESTFLKGMATYRGPSLLNPKAIEVFVVSRTAYARF